eukprot:Ihof_evm1s397 gene=Ihof_evmTU1s397
MTMTETSAIINNLLHKEQSTYQTLIDQHALINELLHGWEQAIAEREYNISKRELSITERENSVCCREAEVARREELVAQREIQASKQLRNNYGPRDGKRKSINEENTDEQSSKKARKDPSDSELAMIMKTVCME